MIWISRLFPWIWGLSILLGGGTTDISKALWLLAGGILLWAFPPTKGPGKKVECVLGLGLLVIALGFMAREWLPHFVRTGVMAEWFPELVPLLAVRPWIALEECFILLCGLAWFYLLLNTRDQNGRSVAMGHVCCVFSILAVVLIIGNWTGLSYPTGEGVYVFSFFPNKNQTSTLFVIGSILCGGYFLRTLGRSPWQTILAMTAVGLNVVALVLAYSRAGLCLGVFGLLLLLVLHYRRASKWIPFSFAVLILGVVLLSSATVYKNFKLSEPVMSQNAYGWAELRPLIYIDTISMIGGESPLGVGLGGFSGVFPQYREHSRVYQVVIHPESDWLWFTAETGWLGGILLLVLAGVVVHSLWRHGILREHWIMAPCLVAVAMVLLHSLVDVPLHRLSLWIIFCWLLVRLWPRASLLSTVIPAWGWRAIGVMFLVGGILLLLPYVGGAALFPKAKLAESEKRLQEAYLSGDIQEAEKRAAEGMRLDPLDWRLNTLLAKVKLEWETDGDAAQKFFQRARILEPVSAIPPYEEGIAWVRYRPDLAVAAFRESVQRSIVNPTDLYRLILEKTISRRMAPYMDDLTRTVPEFRYYYLSRLKGKDFVDAFARDWRSGYFKKQMTEAQQKALLLHWFSEPGASQMQLAGIENLPCFTEAPLGPILLLHYQGRGEDATRALLNWMSAPVWPESSHLRERSTRQLEADFSVNADPVIGMELLRRAFEGKDWGKAMAVISVLQKAHPAPRGLDYWSARILLEQGKWMEAWYKAMARIDTWP